MHDYRITGRLLLAALVLATGVTWGQEPVPAPVDPGPAMTAPPAETAKADRGGGPFGGAGLGVGMGGPGMGPPGYRVAAYPVRPVSGSASDLGLVRQQLAGVFPVWRDGGDTLLMIAGVRNSLFDTNVILPDSGRPFPHQLWNVSLGLLHLHTFDNGWSGGVSATVGSASDQPFHGLAEMNANLFAFLRVPAQNERDAWLFSLMYSPAGNLPYPIPGVAYSWNPSERLNANLGLPLTFFWRPVDDLTLTFFYVPVVNMNARVAYRLSAGANVYAGFEWLNEAYFLAERANRQDRFMAFEKRLVGGTRWDVCRYAVVDLNAGYAFDRYYGEGQSQLGDLTDQVDVRPGPFAGASLLVRW